MADRDQPPPDPRRASSDRTDPAQPPGASPEPAGEPPFEAALDRLEAIVGRLEDGDLALEDALAGFEEGVRLSRRLADRLADAERRIERLVREGGVIATRPLDEACAGEDPEGSA
jgi:exodeoxyribonuclease VII small subunit